jgi:hypothetical protein
MSALKKCPSCGRAGSDIGTCGSHLTCPKQSVPIVATDVVLHCDACEITRVVAAADIIRGKPMRAEHMCIQENCECRPMTLETSPVLRPAGGKAKN